MFFFFLGGGGGGGIMKSIWCLLYSSVTVMYICRVLVLQWWNSLTFNPLPFMPEFMGLSQVCGRKFVLDSGTHCEIYLT